MFQRKKASNDKSTNCPRFQMTKASTSEITMKTMVIIGESVLLYRC
jgi:hypothetical protein